MNEKEIEALILDNRRLRAKVEEPSQLITIGSIYNDRTVVAQASTSKRGERRWVVRCSQGHETTIKNHAVRNNQCRLCLLARNRQHPNFKAAQYGSKRFDLIGKVFGSTTVLKLEHLNGAREAVWKVQCSCGDTRQVRGSKLTSGQSNQCKKCSSSNNIKKARESRHTDKDSFGIKKRSVQKEFWNIVTPVPAFIFVDGSLGEWKMLTDLGFNAEFCCAASLERSAMRLFTERCIALGVHPPRIRKAIDITQTIGVYGKKRIPVTEWIQKELRKRSVKAFGVAHLDFCCSLKTGKPAIEAFLKDGLLADQGILAVTVCYRGDNWLSVWEELIDFVRPFGLTPWLQRSAYADGAPMLFATFQKTG